MNYPVLPKMILLILWVLPAMLLGQDLRPSWDVTPSTANPGQTISIDINLLNLDAGFAPSSRMNYYLSPDNVFNSNAIYLGFDITSVAGNDSEDESANLTLPGVLNCGAYYLLARADVNNEVAETNELNNVAAVGIQICDASDYPDLRPSWNTAPIESNPGHTISITVEVINNGNVSSGAACRMNYYLSPDNVFNTNAIYLGYDMVSSIGAGDSEDENAQLVIPTSLTGGNYFLLAYVDTDNDVLEFNEFNNVKSSPIKIGYTPSICELRQQAPYSFNWRDAVYNIHTFNNGAQIIQSPWTSTLTNNENINEFRTQISKDYEPAEGWELVQEDLGTSVAPVNHPYFILYNRYTGILRFFVMVGDVYDGYDRAEITLEFANSSKRSAILENHTTDDYRNAVDRFDNKVGQIEMANDYAGDLTNYWLHADFVMNYDPCICSNLNQLKFQVRLLDNYTLTFGLNGNAIPQTDMDKSGRSSNFGIQGIIKAITGSVDAGTTASKNVKKGKDLISNVYFPKTGADAATPTLLKNLSNFSLALGKFAVPIAIGKFLVTGLSDKEEESKPMAYDIQLKAEGTLVDEDIALSKIIEVPGSNNLNLIPATEIQYNQPVGVFNLLKTPALYHTKKGIGNSTGGILWYRYRATEELQYTINPLAMIDVAASEMKAAYLFEYEGTLPLSVLEADPIDVGAPAGSFTKLFLVNCEPIDTIGGTPQKPLVNYKYTYSTKFVDFACFDEFTLNFATHFEDLRKRRIYVKVATKLETPAANQTIFMSAYEAKLSSHRFGFMDPFWDGGSTSNCNVLYPADPYLTCNSAIYRRLVNGERITFAYQPKTPSVLRTYQADEAYHFHTSVFPNPATDKVNISVSLPEDSEVNIFLTTIAGTTVTQNLASGSWLSKGNTPLSYETGHLPSGVYILTIQTDMGTQHHRLVLTQ